jgi:hypothetical protein
MGVGYLYFRSAAGGKIPLIFLSAAPDKKGFLTAQSISHKFTKLPALASKGRGGMNM